MVNQMKTMKKHPKYVKSWPKPEEIEAKLARVPVSFRLSGDLAMWYADEAAQQGLNRNELAESVLTAYREWVLKGRA